MLRQVRVAIGAAALLVCVLSVPGCGGWRQIGAAGEHPHPASAPARLRADCATAAAVRLRWETSQPGRSFAPYRIERDGTSLGETRDPFFSDTSVSPSTSYTYVVAPIDSAGTGVASEPLTVHTAAALPNGDAPYCPSPVISSMSWHWDSAYTQSNGSDLWSVTWGTDGNVYTFFGDGGGFGGDDDRGRASFGIARMSEPPPQSSCAGCIAATAANIYGGYNSQHAARIHGKASAIIAVGSSFFAIGGIYSAAEVIQHRNSTSGMPDHVEIVYSEGNAYTWRPNSWQFCSAADARQEGGARGFCPIGFVNFGPGNAGAPDGQVYLLGNANSATYWSGGGGGAQPVHSYLARVAPESILTRAAYRFFAGVDAHGDPIWSADVERMQPVFTDRNRPQPGCGGRCGMAGSLSEAVYNPTLARYIGTAQGNFIGQTSFYDAPHPWGPWTVIEYNNIEAATGAGGWGNLGTAGSTLGVHPVNAWTSADGRTLWVTYSSDGKAPAGALFPPPGASLDSFNLLRVDLNLAASN